MNDKKAHEALQVQMFASPHPALQQQQISTRTNNQVALLPSQHAHASLGSTNRGTHAAAPAGAATAHLPSLQQQAQQQLPVVPQLLQQQQQQQQVVPDHERVILHFDVDCFYCQVEEVRNPSLQGKPLAVTQKYLVVTANYEARAAGVTKLMGLQDALKACPHLVTVAGEDLTPYRAASRDIRAVLSRWGPTEKLGLDESWVDVTQEVESRMASGAAAAAVPSLIEAPQLWPAHIVSSSMALTADSKHRPQDLRVVAATAARSGAAAAAGCAVVEEVDAACVHDVQAAAATGSEGLYSEPAAGAAVSDEALQHVLRFGDESIGYVTPDLAGAAPASKSTSAAAAGAGAAAALGRAWQARLYLGCVIAAEMRAAVARETGYRCSAGIAFNKLLSKLISGLHKPNDQTACPPTEAQAFVAGLPVRALRGVGFKCESVLRGWGVVTAGDAAALSKQMLVQGLGEKQGVWLFGGCRGVDASPVVASGPPKTVSVEDSFKRCSSWAQISTVLQVLVPDLLERLAEDAQEHGARRPASLSIKWRRAGTGWQRSSASAPWPQLPQQQQQQLLCCPAATMHGDGDGAVASNADHAAGVGTQQGVGPQQVEVLTAAALKLLKQHLTGAFNLTLLNIGVSAFKEKPAAAAGGIQQFLHRPAAATAAATDAAKPSATAAAAGAGAIDAGLMLQSAKSSVAARRDYAAAHAAAAAFSQQQQKQQRWGSPGNGAAEGSGQVLLSKRQERRLLEQAAQLQQQQGQQQLHQNQQQGQLGVTTQHWLHAEQQLAQIGSAQGGTQQQQQQQQHQAVSWDRPPKRARHDEAQVVAVQQHGQEHDPAAAAAAAAAGTVAEDMSHDAVDADMGLGCEAGCSFSLHSVDGWGSFSCEVLEGFDDADEADEQQQQQHGARDGGADADDMDAVP